MKTHTRKEFTLRSGRKQIRLGRRTLVMGVVNVTPDSFSDGGRHLKPANAVARGLELLRHGADWIDIGGESTRPGSRPVPVEEELRRVLPVVRGLRKKSKAWISIDTTKAAVADSALRAGAEIVNDVSGLRYDPGLAQVVRRHQAAVVLMHLRGTPRTMQELPQVKNLLPAIRRGLSASIRRALHAGIKKRQIVIDPGIGFGKNADQNFEILKGLPSLTHLGYPILAGPSRKSFLRWALSDLSKTPFRPKSFRHNREVENSVPEELLFGTAAAVTAAY